MFKRLALAACIVLAAMTPATALAGKSTACTAPIIGGSTGDLVVPSGAHCHLFGVTVDGTITVQAGGALDTRNGTSISKHVFARDARRVVLWDTDIYGQVHVTGTTGPVSIGASSCNLDPIAGGNIHLFKNHGYVGVCQMSIRNNLNVQDNDRFVTLIENRAGNNIIVQRNVSTHIFDNEADNNLICHGNAPLKYSGNVVGGKAIGQCRV